MACLLLPKYQKLSINVLQPSWAFNYVKSMNLDSTLSTLYYTRASQTFGCITPSISIWGLHPPNSPTPLKSQKADNVHAFIQVLLSWTEPPEVRKCWTQTCICIKPLRRGGLRALSVEPDQVISRVNTDFPPVHEKRKQVTAHCSELTFSLEKGRNVTNVRT